MIWIDYLIIIVISISIVISLFRGFIHEALSLTTWICAFYVSHQSHQYVMKWISDFYGNNLISKIISLVIPFIMTMITGTILSNIIRFLIKKRGLSSTDRILGMCFGAIRGILVMALIIFCMNVFTDIPKDEDWKRSHLIPHINYVVRILFDYLKTYRIFRFDENAEKSFSTRK
ncbi:CvpA family protein [Candidatus Pantoea edessiphila]|nr:CvpA family protein [Candidatus Pantoea edessiphila]